VTLRRAAFPAGLTVAAAVLGWILFIGLPQWSGNRRPQPAAPAASASAAPGRKIKAHLFYVAESGLKLTSIEQDVPYGEGTVEQARAIITAQVGPAALPLVSAVPAGTTLRALFVTPDGEVFVDFSRELMTTHPGGSLNELLTVYTIVQALTANLPVVTAVQLLVDGKEVDTLSGHVDLRRPLVKNLAWVE
jgi:spore germination protein GerM